MGRKIMQNKLKPLIIILFVLGGFLALKSYWSKIIPEKSPYFTKLGSLQKDQIQKIEFEKDAAKLELMKDGEVWQTMGKKADKNKIDNFFSGLYPDSAPELASQNEERLGEFQVSSSSATRVMLNGKVNILFGKAASIGGIYARFDGDNNVYILNNINANDTLTSASFWADKTVFVVEVGKLTKFSIQYIGRNLILLKRDNKWIEEKSGKEPDKDKLEEFLSSVSNITALSVPEENVSGNYPKLSTLKIDIEYEGGSESLEFFEGKENYLIIRKSDGEQFTVSKSSVEKFSDFLKQ